MTAAELIEHFKALPPSEQAEVSRFVFDNAHVLLTELFDEDNSHAEPGSIEGQVRKEASGCCQLRESADRDSARETRERIAVAPVRRNWSFAPPSGWFPGGDASWHGSNFKVEGQL